VNVKQLTHTLPLMAAAEAFNCSILMEALQWSSSSMKDYQGHQWKIEAMNGYLLDRDPFSSHNS